MPVTGTGNAARFAARPLSGGGTSALAWTAWGRRFPELDLRGCKSLLVVAPHPDDETLGFGAAAATLQIRGVKVQVVSVTDGDASHPGLPIRKRRELAVPWERASRISPDRFGIARKWRAAEMFRSQLEPHGSGQAVLPPFVLERLRAVGEVVFT